ncbi:hypothetical protein [Streptomyces flaveus]|uniref:hypothetical protein n=1 Tax=Streptomyces flaveus TaxID=66370 RepID=UPI0033314262
MNSAASPAEVASQTGAALVMIFAIALTGCTSNECTDSICGSNNDKGSIAAGEQTPAARVNTSYLADLIRKGPFSEPLPKPVKVTGMKDVLIADSSPRIDAVAVELDWPSEYDPFEGFDGPNGHIETYRAKADAAKRSESRYNTLRKQYKDFGEIQGTTKGFFIFANGEIIAGGTRGYVYVEVYSFTNANAYIPLATGTVNSMLKYADKMTALATDS